MFQITPIGSCRIATPLRLARDLYGFQLNQDRVYGYCHSSAEAVQLMRYLKREIVVDPMIEPLVSRRGVVGDEIHDPADLYVIELCSSKLLRLGETCVQLNYVSAEYADFFANRARATEYWEISEASDQAAMDRFLTEHWAATVDQKRDAELLRLIRRSNSTEADLRRDIRILIDALPAALFITHVDAQMPDGKPIPSRSQFIKSVERAVKAEGGIVYNPTRAMHRMGQRQAIEDHSDSLAHFTEEFSHLVFQGWFDLAIAPLIDRMVTAGGEGEVRRVLRPHVEARLAAGEAAPLAPRLKRIAGALPDSIEVRSLLASTYSAIGQAEAALKTLRSLPLTGKAPADAAILRQRADLGLDLHDLDEVEHCLTTLATLRVPLAARELQVAGEAMAQGGRPEAAFRFYLLALQRDPLLARAAEEILAIGRSCSALLVQLDARQRALVADLLSSAQRLVFLHLAGETVALTAMVVAKGVVAPGDLVDLVRLLTIEGQIGEAANLLERWRASQGLERLGDPGLRAVIDDWVKQSSDAEDREQEIALLAFALAANPLHTEGRIRMRALRKELLNDIRTACEAEDLAALDDLKLQVDRLGEPIREFGIHRMRILFNIGQYAEAIEAANEVVAEAPDNVVAWATMMRAAQKSGDLLVLDRAARKIIDHADEDSRRLEDEARERLERNPVRCFRAARDDHDPVRAYRLFTIARRDPALARSADIRLRRIEAQLTTTLRKMEAEGEDGFEPLAQALALLLPENEKLRQTLGRYHVKRRDFAAALPHWQFLNDKEPANESYAFQAQRCRDQLAQKEAVGV